MNKRDKEIVAIVKKYMADNGYELINTTWSRGHYPYWDDVVLCRKSSNLCTVFEFVYDKQGGDNINHYAKFYNFLYQNLVKKKRTYWVWLPFTVWKQMYSKLNEEDAIFATLKQISC